MNNDSENRKRLKMWLIKTCQNPSPRTSRTDDERTVYLVLPVVVGAVLFLVTVPHGFLQKVEAKTFQTVVWPARALLLK
jgi:hypothetical protein